MDQRFGRGRVIDHLIGKPPRDNLDEQYTTRSTYGVGAETPEPQWRRVIEHLLFEGILAEDDSERPTLGIGEQEAVRAIFRKELAIRVREEAKTTRRSKEDRRASRGAKRAARTGLEGDDAKLFEALRTWRRETAAVAGVPPYVIFHDATLVAIVAAKPSSLAALGRVAGIGDAKLKRHGEQVLVVLSR